jgi:hypothetical protein
MDGRRIERKFVLHRVAAATVLAWLAHACRPDPRHPGGTITSIYYDTADWRAYVEHRDGDVVKTKVRVRWYGEPDPSASPWTDAYLEVKRKQGAFGIKRRRPLRLPTADIRNRSGRSPLSPGELNRLLFEFGVEPAGPLFPVMAIRYMRHRFVDLRAPFRYSADSAISSRILDTRLSPATTPVRLDCTVLEVKGPSVASPGTLSPLRGLALRPGAFSKYAACLEAVAQLHPR